MAPPKGHQAFGQGGGRREDNLRPPLTRVYLLAESSLAPSPPWPRRWPPWAEECAAWADQTCPARPPPPQALAGSLLPAETVDGQAQQQRQLSFSFSVVLVHRIYEYIIYDISQRLGTTGSKKNSIQPCHAPYNFRISHQSCHAPRTPQFHSSMNLCLPRR